MPRFFFVVCQIALLLATAGSIQAHPAVGIVMDSTGAVFYSDTAQVWRIAPDGTRTVAVPGVHTHSLWLDPMGNLYGEHLSGGGSWTHRVWKRSTDGRISDVIPTRAGFLEDRRDFSLVRDARGSMYWFDTGSGGGILRREGNGPIQTVAKLSVRESGWLSVLPDGTSIVVDHGELVKVTRDGQIRRLPGQLASKAERYSVMAVWADGQQDLYVAVYSDGAVRKISPDGRVTTIVESPAPWQPTGGLLAPDGAMWVLETSPSNQQRVRRVGRDGSARVF